MAERVKRARKKGVNRSVNKRVSPSTFKIRKSIALSKWLWSKIELYSDKFRVNRSQAVERGMMEFLSNQIHDDIAELKTAKIKVAMLEQKIKNNTEIEQLVSKG